MQLRLQEKRERFTRNLLYYTLRGPKVIGIQFAVAELPDSCVYDSLDTRK